jgi:murein DD-endopeptidase MepM/ murein hydrolase activator NlpD
MTTIHSLRGPILLVAIAGSIAAPGPGTSTAAAQAYPGVVGSPTSPAIRWTPLAVAEGTLFSVLIESADQLVTVASGTFAGQPLHFRASESGALVALAAAPLDSIGSRELRVTMTLRDGRREQEVMTVNVDRGTYAMQRLTVAPQFGAPQPPEIQRRIEAESARAFAVSAASHNTPRMWEPPFVAPRESRITSGFGHGRTFNGQIQSRHTGTDYSGAVGTPVRAPARARVALVDDFYLGGGVIYLDHGAGLVTGYLHLSEQLVAEGDIVEPGQVIGRVGATGRVTGPHLHWIVRYGPHSVDGATLLSYPVTPGR